MGVPVVTCTCAVCNSQDRRNHRLRPSGLLKARGKQILMDAGPDFREQALTNGIKQLDGVVLTHSHYDHIAGLDDLRVFYYLHNQLLPCLLSRATYEELKVRTPYFFEKEKEETMGGPRFDYHVIEKETTSAQFCGFEWNFVTYAQNKMEVTGFKVGNFAYVMDLKEFSPEIFNRLQGVEVLVISGLRHRPSPAHLTLDEAVEFSRKVGAKETWFSHIAHDLDHEKTNRQLPQGVQLAYDGLTVKVQC